MGSDEREVAEARFHDRLQEVVTDAAADGVAVEGAWPVQRDDPDAQDWDVEIVELATSRE